MLAAFAAISAAIVDLMTMLTSLFKTVDRSVAMLDKVVATAQQKQSITVAGEIKNFRARYTEETALQCCERRTRVAAWCAISPKHASDYAAVYEELDTAIDAALAADVKSKPVD